MRAMRNLFLLMLTLLALMLSFFSFMFRADSWNEVSETRTINYMVIGPLWAILFFFSARVYTSTNTKKAILVAFFAYIISATCLSGWTEMVFSVRVGQEVSKSDAIENLPIVEAICNYRAEYGMLPYSLNDLVPHFLDTIPNDRKLQWERKMLLVHYSLLLYDFDNDNEGWSSKLNLPKVTPTRPVAKGEAAFEARLSEYDRRIAKAITYLTQ